MIKGNLLNRELVCAAAEKLGFDVNVWSKGKFSMGMAFCSIASGRRLAENYIEVICAGNTYWIEVGRQGSTQHQEKWCMPRKEVCGDKADDFLVEILKNYECDCDLATTVSIVLGIDAVASRGYTREVLSKKRNSAMISKNCVKNEAVQQI